MNMEFNTKEELHKYLVDNKKSLIDSKKGAIKHSDGIDFINAKFIDKDSADKAEMNAEQLEIGTIQVKVVINTTNIIDSHMDCHIPKLWNKSLSEQKKIKLLKEHKATFECIISDQVTPSVKTMSWKSLGFDFEGSTQALIFDAIIKEHRNSYMFSQYKQGYVDNHSVGMRYVTLYLCINSEERWAREEKEYWDKYYPMVVNKEVADDNGYFWAVTEAKMVEGSAVVFGSNYATPTLLVRGRDEEEEDMKHEPDSTHKEANSEPLDTQMDINEFKTIIKQSLNIK